MFNRRDFIKSLAAACGAAIVAQLPFGSFAEDVEPYNVWDWPVEYPLVIKAEWWNGDFTNNLQKLNINGRDFSRDPKAIKYVQNWVTGVPHLADTYDIAFEGKLCKLNVTVELLLPTVDYRKDLVC